MCTEYVAGFESCMIFSKVCHQNKNTHTYLPTHTRTHTRARHRERKYMRLALSHSARTPDSHICYTLHLFIDKHWSDEVRWPDAKKRKTLSKFCPFGGYTIGSIDGELHTFDLSEKCMFFGRKNVLKVLWVILQPLEFYHTFFFCNGVLTVSSWH